MIDIGPDFKAWLSEVRRDLHRHPELAYNETRTSDKIADILSGLGLAVTRFDDLTGVVGLLKCGSEGPCLAFRADIDALAMDELNDHDFKSVHPGRMHACGHDAHTTIMLGVAKCMVETGLAGRLAGKIKFLFQPAEEGGAGARAMIERGVLENPRVDRVLAGHMLPELEAGTVGIFESMSHASADMFSLTVTGKGAHGGRPHQGSDPIVAASHLVVGLQSIVGRNVDPLDAAVISVGSFVSGKAHNVIPEQAQLGGTIRALTPEVRELLHNRIGQVCAGVEAAFNVNIDLNIEHGYPPCINDPAVCSFMAETGREILGDNKVQIMPPSTGGEDFAFFAQEREAAIIRVGCGKPGVDNPPLHSPYFDIDDKALETGVKVFCHAAERYLGEG